MPVPNLLSGAGGANNVSIDGINPGLRPAAWEMRVLVPPDSSSSDVTPPTDSPPTKTSLGNTSPVIEALDVLYDGLMVLDERIGPRALGVAVQWLTHGRALSNDDVAQAERSCDSILRAARCLAKYTATVPQVSEYLAGIITTVGEWLTRLHAPDRPTTSCEVAREGIATLLAGDRAVKAALATVDDIRAGRQPKVKVQRKRGRKPSRGPLVKRMLELSGGAEPTPAIGHILAAEFGYEYSLDTLKRYYRDRDRCRS